MVYPQDPWEVNPLGDVGSRLDAYVEFRGEMALNQVMRIGYVMAETVVNVWASRGGPEPFLQPPPRRRHCRGPGQPQFVGNPHRPHEAG